MNGLMTHGGKRWVLVGSIPTLPRFPHSAYVYTYTHMNMELWCLPPFTIIIQFMLVKSTSTVVEESTIEILIVNCISDKLNTVMIMR